MSLKKLGRYDLIRVVGKGAMGLVYEGRDPNLDRRVAIKTIKVENLSAEAEAEYEVRFRTEARSAARLQHPNIVSVYDSDRDGDIAFLVMEYIQGEDLKHYLDQGKRHTLKETLGIMTDLLSALDYAHQQKIVHRDIKPANLLIEGGGRVKLTDFGVARIQDSGDATRTRGSMVGTLKYMSPEQVQGQSVDARADVFAAGIVLYQLLTGRRPFDGESDFAIIHQIVGQDPDPPTTLNSKLPRAIDAVVAKALAKSRDKRFATAQEFAAALTAAAAQATDPTVVPPDSTFGPGMTATWTGTLRKGEGLVGTGSGTGTGGSIVTQEVELVYWKDVKNSTEVEDLQGFIDKFPSGIYADLARRRLKRLQLPGADDSIADSGMRTQLAQGPTGALDKTELMPRNTPADAGAAHPDRAEQAWKALEAAASAPKPRDEVVQAARGAPRTPGPARPPVARDAGPSTLPPAPNAGRSAREARSPPAGVARPEPASAPATRRGMWAVASIALLAGVVLAFKLLSGGDTPPVQSATPAEPGPAATNAAPAAAEKPLATDKATAAGPSAAAPPAGVTAVATAVAALPASAASAARKIAADKDKSAKPAQTNTAATAPLPEPPPAERARPAPAPAAPVAAAQPVPANRPAAPADPRQACQDRQFLSYQICMAEQCAKPLFANTAECVQRQAMERKRLDAADQNRR